MKHQCDVLGVKENGCEEIRFNYGGESGGDKLI